MNKLWHGRFTKETQSEAEAFGASIFFDYALVEEDIQGSLAHVQMLASSRILSSDEALEIRQGLLTLKEQFSQGKIAFSARDEDIHMKVESELTKLIGPLAGKLHTARSRNDQVALDMHLYVRKHVISLVLKLTELQAALLHLAKAHQETIMPGYTHLQRAQPILLAHHLLAYVAMFERDCQRLMASWPRINTLPLGACALAGTGFAIDRPLVANLLKFDHIYQNSIDAVSDRDFCIEFLADGALIMTHLSRLSEELILWCSQEFGFIELDDAYCTGSSIMPQKKNPDIPELVRGKTGRVYGALIGSLTMLKGLPLAYNKDLQEDKEALFDTVKTLEQSLSIYKDVINTLRVHPDRMLQATEQGLLNATELADYLVSKGLPFREAHAVAGKIVRFCLDSKKTLEELSLQELHHYSPLFTEDVYSALDLKQIIRTRNSLGGTSYMQVGHQLQMAFQTLEKTNAWIVEKQRLLSGIH